MSWAIASKVLFWLLGHVKANWRTYALATVCFFGGCYFRGCVEDVFESPVGAMGWIEDPDGVDAVLATMPQPVFADAAAGLVAEEKDALLYRASIDLGGKVLSPHNQGGVGSCVGHGTAVTIDCLQCVQIVLGKAPHEFKDVSAAACYALSREMNGMLGRGDGSTGAGAAKAITTLGTITCEDAKEDDTDPDGNTGLCKKWGRSGLPREFKDLAKKHIVKTASQVRSAEEVRVCLTNGYPVIVCSNVGFTTRRDSDGFCKRSGTWNHCMSVQGYRKDKRAFLIVNSWGENSPSGPRTLDQPPNSFWIVWDTMDQMARQRDSYAVSAYEGFPAQRIDWFALARPAKPREPLAARLAHAFALAP